MTADSKCASVRYNVQTATYSGTTERNCDVTFERGTTIYTGSASESGEF